MRNAKEKIAGRTPRGGPMPNAGGNFSMRFILLILILLMGLAGSSFAQQSAPKTKAKDPKRCTHEACVQRGVQKMGYSSSVAGNWCSKNNNGC
jgi:hypothetical protein